MYLMTETRRNPTRRLLEKIVCQTRADDELTEASICQRVRNLENNLFDEYWDELLAYRRQIQCNGR